MIRALVLLALVGCGSSKPAPEPAPAKWPVPDGWKEETIPFPLGFAPSIAHEGVEELRFAPGFSKLGTPDVWVYAFVWRLTDRAELDAAQLAGELTAYFRGLMVAVDGDKKRIVPEKITAEVKPGQGKFEIRARVLDAFHGAEEVELVGWARRTSCGSGSLWTFALAPPGSPGRGAVDALAEQARCR